MSTRFFSYLINPRDLADALEKQKSHPPASDESRIVPISAEWYLPNVARKGYEEFTKCRIPGARFFDVDAIKDPNSPYPHMLPDGKIFAEHMSKMGIRRNDTVVVYDSPHIGIFSAPRAAWTFRVFGHPNVHVLNNFKLWVEMGLPTEGGEKKKDWEETDYPVVDLDKELVVDYEDMLGLVDEGARDGVEIMDARPVGRFWGEEPEPRPEISSGHAPGAISMPFTELIDPTTKALKPASQLRNIFLSKGIDPSPATEKVLMCGTGVTAVVIETALQEAGIEGKRKVYDGSWTEWAQRVPKDSKLIVKEEEEEEE